MKLAWLTDIHLNFLNKEDVAFFCDELSNVEADAFLISGDIGEAPDVGEYLEQLDDAVKRPIYFVLGNHDFYRGSITDVRKRVEGLCITSRNLHWMPLSGVVPLTDDTCLVGHDGWADGRLGDYEGSEVELNDFLFIRELTGLSKAGRLARMKELGDEAAAQLQEILPDALERFRHVIVLTHVPPFKESCWHEGKVSNDDWLPLFSCKAIGDVLREAVVDKLDRQMTVLCGHTHGEGETQILPNLKVLTGGAVYGEPRGQREWEVV